MASDWDEPVAAGARAGPSRGERIRAERTPASEGWSNGLLDPLALVAFLMRNALKIAVIGTVLTALGIGAVMFVPFPYRATAIVLADPRDQRVTLQEEVLPAIGTDAAVLESMVQIVRSDSFLLQAMRRLGILTSSGAEAAGEEELRQLARFRRNMSVERKGATYLVEISYRAPSAGEAAQVANGLAEAFADSQNDSRSEATGNASRSLAARLVEIRAQLNESEEAVAAFRAEHGIVYVDERNTLQMRQLSELNQQLALARNATEEARARHDEHRNGGAITRAGQGDGESAQLSYLRQQRSQLLQARDQQAQVYGPRHPRLIQTQQMIASVEQQIQQERRLFADQLKTELDVAVAKQAQLERQIAGLSSEVTLTDTARVQLEALEREATANRDLYQQLLARNKATDELALLTEDNVRIVSAAVPPLLSTRPPLVLLGPAIAFLGFAAATGLVVAGNLGGFMKRGARAGLRRREPEPYSTASRRERDPYRAAARRDRSGSLADDDWSPVPAPSAPREPFSKRVHSLLSARAPLAQPEPEPVRSGSLLSLAQSERERAPARAAVQRRYAQR